MRKSYHIFSYLFNYCSTRVSMDVIVTNCKAGWQAIQKGLTTYLLSTMDIAVWLNVYSTLMFLPQERNLPKISYTWTQPTAFFSNCDSPSILYGWNISWNNMGLFGLQVLQEVIILRTPKKCTIICEIPHLITYASAYLWSAVQNLLMYFPLIVHFLGLVNVYNPCKWVRK